jgi:hypothetical protein
MKTPREILLARHRAVEPKLDALRQQAVAGIRASERNDTGLNRVAVAVREFFRIPRLAWSGLAAAWLIIIALNFAARETPRATALQMAGNRPSSETLQALREQKRLFAELVGTGAARDADAPRLSPRPRSERQPQICFA